MIDIEVRIHDRFSLEFKIGYVVNRKNKENDFMINTWIFVPSSLDINSFTYNKKEFYRDVKSNIRLITPVYQLEAVANPQAIPFMFLEGAFNEVLAEPNEENMADFEYQIKMFISIVKSALRKETYFIIKNPDNTDRKFLIDNYIKYIEQITHKYRNLQKIITNPNIPNEAHSYFAFGDEFLSNLIEQYTFRILHQLAKTFPKDYQEWKKPLLQLIEKEVEYKISKGYQIVEKESKDKNRSLILRTRLLKKYIESHLFLNANKKKDGRVAEQLYYSLAAGISMIFATAIAFSFQLRYGNFTMPLFVALVISYMLKDRIKETGRYYFARRLSKKYFDNKTLISIKNENIGCIKEGMDYITDNYVPEEIMKLRERSDILEANNRNNQEQIILYRKLVNIDGKALDDNNQYDISGINDIVRFNISNYTLKMDNPEVPLIILDEKKDYEVINGERIYYVNFLIQLQYEGKVEYKRFRLSLSRNGIKGIEKFKTIV